MLAVPDHPARGGGRPSLLVARGVCRSYGRHAALAPVDLDVRAGEVVALIGPNGAGKSTLLSILAGALAPDRGEVVVGPETGRVGWVPQRPAQYGRLTPRENLELFGRLEGIPDPSERAARLLELVDLPDDGRLGAELSLGNQQRLNLAIALLAQPDVLLLDEPTASLDPRQRRRFWDVGRAVSARGGAVVFVTQNLEELERVADRVVVLLDGELVFDGSRAEYERSPEADVFA
ncbi:MAG TPA: ABC transporter ATP-binding protein [Gaiellaceae bacterium]|nr:ABC transporter ATP-binding protein [Gaiellaceae bacterium]